MRCFLQNQQIQAVNSEYHSEYTQYNYAAVVWKNGDCYSITKL